MLHQRETVLSLANCMLLHVTAAPPAAACFFAQLIPACQSGMELGLIKTNIGPCLQLTAASLVLYIL